MTIKKNRFIVYLVFDFKFGLNLKRLLLSIYYLKDVWSKIYLSVFEVMISSRNHIADPLRGGLAKDAERSFRFSPILHLAPE